MLLILLQNMGELGGMVDAQDLKSCVRFGRVGSSPTVRTTCIIFE